jgi:hypothetical protein
MNIRVLLAVLPAVLSAFVLSSCDEESKEVSPVAMLISPVASDSVVLSSGDHTRYSMTLHTVNDRVERLAVSSFDAEYGSRSVLDTTFSKKVDEFVFDYKAPVINRDSLPVTLTFESWDNKGNYCSVDRQLLIRNRQVVIDEKSGIVLRSSDSGFADAFCFASPSQTFSWQHSPDSVRADVYLSASSDFMSLSLCSNTAAKMVRNNSFDYPAATASSIQAVYSSSRRDDVVSDLRVNDIILVGHDAQAEGVLRVSNIIRTGMPDERCVQLSFKGLTR